MTMQLASNTSVGLPTAPSQPSSTEVTVNQQEKRKVLDRVFTEIGFDRFFLDQKDAPRKPHLKTTDLDTPLILHIDDDEDLVDAVTSRLLANGYRVASALDGVSGVQSALVYPADAIILDYDMPNGRGDTVIDLLKGSKNTQNIPVIVLTAVHQKGLKRQLLNKGADVFMTKPFEFDELEATLASLIDSRNEG